MRGAPAVALQVLEQAAPHAYIQQLGTAADAQQWQPVLQCPVDGGALEGIAFAVVARMDFRLGGIEHRVDIVATGYHQCIQAGETRRLAGAQLHRAGAAEP